jgi:arsenate reductase-like glutaredoxin family protein
MHTHINNDIKFDEHINGRIKSNSLDSNGNVTENNTNERNSESDRENTIGIESQNNNTQDPFEYDTISSTSSVNTQNTIVSSKNNSTNDNIVRIRNDSLSESKRNFKEMLKNNVNKVSSMLQICKPKNTKDVIESHSPTLKTEVSNEDLQNLFSNVNTTCDSIINQEAKEQIDLDVDISTNENIVVEIVENDHTLNQFIKSNEENETIQQAVIEETYHVDDILEDESVPFVEVLVAIEEVAIEEVAIEDVAIEDVADLVSLSDENSLPSSYSESYTTENEVSNEQSVINTEPKKKRNYKPRKKKTDV